MAGHYRFAFPVEDEVDPGVNQLPRLLAAVHFSRYVDVGVSAELEVRSKNLSRGGVVINEPRFPKRHAVVGIEDYVHIFQLVQGQETPDSPVKVVQGSKVGPGANDMSEEIGAEPEDLGVAELL
jgi:hypothetical protein